MDRDVERHHVVFADSRSRLALFPVAEVRRNRHEKFDSDFVAGDGLPPSLDHCGKVGAHRKPAAVGGVEGLAFAPHLTHIVGYDVVFLGDRRPRPLFKDGHGQLVGRLRLGEGDEGGLTRGVQRRRLAVSFGNGAGGTALLRGGRGRLAAFAVAGGSAGGKHKGERRRACGGDLSMRHQRSRQWKESPHAHEPAAFGLSIVKP